ncbi:type II toxin-antitoxin system death-on-curing family toxin [Motilibacter deserti]|uniref:Fido domain-containing protein n=1 Tax=Motilibacter deserti TaxID=2714956 RepID=A0ABX0GS07_9ACTN|nr:hypothetical protein [Motilibacter deserti]
MTLFLSTHQLATISDIAIDGRALVRDVALLAAVAGRPAAEFGGISAFPTIHHKAGALLHACVSSHPLVDGNKRLAWLAACVFLQVNGQRLVAPEDDAFDLVMAAASNSATPGQIARRLSIWSSS